MKDWMLIAILNGVAMPGLHAAVHASSRTCSSHVRPLHLNSPV